MARTEYVHINPIVEYCGSITDMHGLWYVESFRDRYTLGCGRGLTLRGVRPQHVRPVEVPKMTRLRAEALKRVASAGWWWGLPEAYALSSREKSWLTARGFVTVDNGKLRVTDLGFEVLHAIRWF